MIVQFSFVMELMQILCRHVLTYVLQVHLELLNDPACYPPSVPLLLVLEGNI